MVDFDMQLKQNGTLQIRLTPLQGRRWRGVERRLFLTQFVEMVDDDRILKIVVKDERGVVAALPKSRNDYSQRIPNHVAINLIELDDKEARIEAWNYLSSDVKTQAAIRKFHNGPEAVANLKSGIPSAIEVERMIEGDPAPFDCPVCGSAAETNIERHEEDGVLEVVLRCDRGHETRRPT